MSKIIQDSNINLKILISFKVNLSFSSKPSFIRIDDKFLIIKSFFIFLDILWLNMHLKIKTESIIILNRSDFKKRTNSCCKESSSFSHSFITIKMCTNLNCFAKEFLKCLLNLRNTYTSTNKFNYWNIFFSSISNLKHFFNGPN